MHSKSTILHQIDDLLAKLEGYCWEVEDFEARFGSQVKWIRKRMPTLMAKEKVHVSPKIVDAMHDLERSILTLRNVLK